MLQNHFIFLSLILSLPPPPLFFPYSFASFYLCLSVWSLCLSLFSTPSVDIDSIYFSVYPVVSTKSFWLTLSFSSSPPPLSLSLSLSLSFSFFLVSKSMSLQLCPCCPSLYILFSLSSHLCLSVSVYLSICVSACLCLSVCLSLSLFLFTKETTASRLPYI